VDLRIAESAAPRWLTTDQRIALSGLVGDWRSWLLRQLDVYWPNWNEATDAERRAWVDQVLSIATPPRGDACTDTQNCA
jgi:hypothetical protein